MIMNSVLYGARRKRVGGLVAAAVALVFLVACGGSGAPATPTSMVKHRAFVSNSFSGNLQIVDTQNDTTGFTPESTNSAGQLVPGVPVTVTVSGTVSFEVESPNNTITVVYDPGTNALFFVTNSTEMVTGAVPLTSAASMALFSPESTKIYAPEPNLPVTGARAGGVEVVTLSSSVVTATYDVPSARSIALSPSGQYLLVFAANSDSVFVVD